MLRLDFDIHPAALIDRRPEYLAPMISGLDGIWITAAEPYVSFDENGLFEASSMVGGAVFQRVKPNFGNQQLAEQGSGIVFHAGQNCGLFAKFPNGLGQVVSCALRFTSASQNAKTLLTFNPTGQDNYVFLSQSGRELLLKDQQTTQECVVQHDAPYADIGVLLAITDERLSLQVVDGAFIQSKYGMDIDLRQSMEVFLGCRKNRGGLQKTLGEFVLKDFILLPDLDIFADMDRPCQIRHELERYLNSGSKYGI